MEGAPNWQGARKGLRRWVVVPISRGTPQRLPHHHPRKENKMIPIVDIAGARQTGKTHVALAVAVLDAINGSQVCYIAENQAQARTALERVVSSVIPDIVSRAQGVLTVQFDGGGQIAFMSRRQNPRGLSFDLIVNDAISDVRWEEWNPTLHTSSDPRIVFVNHREMD